MDVEPLTSHHLPQKITALHILTPCKKKQNSPRKANPICSFGGDEARKAAQRIGDNWEGVQKVICWLQLACTALLRTIYRIRERGESATDRLRGLQKIKRNIFLHEAGQEVVCVCYSLRKHLSPTFLKGGQI